DLEMLDPRLKDSTFTALCDCLNPLTGSTGAALTYAPQKGASPALVQELELAMEQFARIVKQDLGKDIASLEGSGAAGGLAAGLAVLGANLEPGIDMILKLIHFEEAIIKASLVITGEGRMDRQTSFNKAPLGVAKAAKRAHVPVLAIVGSLGEGYEEVHKWGIDAIIPLSFTPFSHSQASLDIIARATEEALRCVLI
ncbi:MAG: glycerate kinase, partial [Parachlamydia sp.]|nr:glycerate kinase [Parachlamydia sp.]